METVHRPQALVVVELGVAARPLHPVLPVAVVQAQLLPELMGGQADAILAHGPDLHLAQADAAQAFGGGQLAQVLDQAIDLLGWEILTPAEGAQDALGDFAVDPGALNDRAVRCAVIVNCG